MSRLRRAGNHLYKPLFDTKSKVTEIVAQNLPSGDVTIFTAHMIYGRIYRSSMDLVGDPMRKKTIIAYKDSIYRSGFGVD